MRSTPMGRKSRFFSERETRRAKHGAQFARRLRRGLERARHPLRARQLALGNLNPRRTPPSFTTSFNGLRFTEGYQAYQAGFKFT